MGIASAESHTTSVNAFSSLPWKEKEEKEKKEKNEKKKKKEKKEEKEEKEKKIYIDKLKLIRHN